MAHRKTPLQIESLLTGAQLPALPHSALRLLQLSQDPDNGPAEFAVPIEADPGLTGQVLKFVNSSYFGFSREVSSIKLAITLVGIRTIKNFSLWSAVFSLMPNPKCGPFDLRSLWQDSLRRGLFARAMGRLLGQVESEDLFAAALLQDMALPLLAKELPEEYVRLFQARQGGRTRLSQLEQERFGWTHAQAGSIVAAKWSLPETFGHLIEGHARFEEMVSEGASPGEVAVSLSALLPSVQDSVWHEREQFIDAYRQLTGHAESELVPLLEDIDKSFEEFAPVLKLGTPAQSLVANLERTEPATA
ncbi:MAG: HDOD domain-containing protein [Planctomycetes bacterium]|nr:HDOD domain-containing protein [Planctomycetota bacterium]